jgi:hypothetical protein
MVYSWIYHVYSSDIGEDSIHMECTWYIETIFQAYTQNQGSRWIGLRLAASAGALLMPALAAPLKISPVQPPTQILVASADRTWI